MTETVDPTEMITKNLEDYTKVDKVVVGCESTDSNLESSL